MKKIFLFTTLTALTFVMAFAQTEFPQTKAKRMVSKIHIACNLQGTEWGKVNNALVDYYTKLDAMDKQKATLGDAYATQLASLKTTRDATIKAALTPEQVTKYETVVAAEKQ